MVTSSAPVYATEPLRETAQKHRVSGQFRYAHRMSVDDVELPDPVRSSFIHEGNELLTYTWSSPGQPRVLLIHGIGMGHWVYSSFIAALRKHTSMSDGTPWEVVAVDLPGFGDCPEPQEAQSIAATADLIAHSLQFERPGEPLIVVGHSMGAQVATELAARHPHFVSRLVLIGATVNPAERSATQQALRMVQDLANVTVSVLVKGVIAYAQTGPKWFIEKLEPTIEHRIEDTLPRVTQPTLVLRGADDPVCPREWGAEIVSLVPNAEYSEVEGHGHETIIADGEPAVRELTEWLTRVGMSNQP